MDLLKLFTPEQLKALSPECLQILLKSDNNLDNVVEMKHYFDTLTYTLNNSYMDANCDRNGMLNIRKILLKCGKQMFYLTYELDKNNQSYATKWKLYTKDEILNILPTGIDLDQVCFSKGNKPFNFL